MEDTADYRDCYLGRLYDPENRLKREEDKLRTYQIQQISAWKKWPFGAILIAIGGMSAFVILCLGGLFGLISAILIGGYLIYWGTIILWECFINSAEPLAYRIAKSCGIRSLSVKIEETYRMIKAVQHGLRVRKGETDV